MELVASWNKAAPLAVKLLLAAMVVLAARLISVALVAPIDKLVAVVASIEPVCITPAI